jgi:large subunit ribosomal protein L9
VKNGYGRNYLIPQGFALEANKKNVAMVEAEKARIEARLAREAEQVREEAKKLAGLKLNIKAKTGEAGKLYGSVTNMDLAKEMAEQGFEIDRRRILLTAPIKEVGEFTVQVKLHPQVIEAISVTVESENPPQEVKPAEAKAEEEAVEAEAGEEAAEEVEETGEPEAAEEVKED